MSVSESRRYRLYEVQARIDEEAAETLMELLPPVGWADVATKHDLQQMELRIGLRFQQVDRRFEEVDRRFEEVDRRFEEVDRRFEGIEQRLGRVEERLDGLKTSFIGWLLASQATVVAVVIGAATLFN